ncbi:potassium transporter TrkG [Deinococcus sp.]|uniref:potassium transporter TrkG n=1 Tax=Deinococcus sp. TaxID=47478 RepID=UPI002869EC5B|nr:potassium transporter TrkG [Deinococcus sp.]
MRIVIVTALLHLPGVTVRGAALSSVDLLFTATSAICITGLVVTDTAEAFTRFGQVLLLVFVQVGGLGILTFGTLFAYLTGRRLNFSERQTLVAQLNALNVGGVLPLLKTILASTLVSEAVGMLLLAWRFVPHLYPAAYHAVSAYNHAGFAVLRGGMAPYVGDPLVNLTISVLVILGGQGVLVQLNIASHVLRPRRHRLLVYSRLTLWTTALLLGVGLLVILLLEWQNGRTLAPPGTGAKLLASFFQSMTPRSGGFATLNIKAMNTATIFTLIGLMFIGANSGSTGGGIKTSTSRSWWAARGTWRAARAN